MSLSIGNDIAEIIERFQDEEALDWEIKAARGGLPHSIWETVSAFSNTHGGWLILGIAERDSQIIVEGVTNPSTMVRQLHDQMRNTAKISYPACGAADIHTVESHGKYIVALRVPPAPRRVRPVYTKDNPYNGTYVRRNEGDYPATRVEVDRMMREASDVTADQVILEGYGWEDIDRETFRRYRQRFQNAQPNSPHNSADDETFLSIVGGYRKDRQTGSSGMTVAGLLMFGTDEAIRSWRGRHLIDFRLVPGDPTLIAQTDWIDRFVWEGNLLGCYEHISRRLVENLPVPFVLEQGIRQDQSEQQIAIREAFVNLLLHADYTERDASLIVRSPEGYFFRNPGNSRVPDLDPVHGSRSDPRNPELVRMFRLIGLAEEAGSGVPRMVQTWRKLGYESPLFDLGESHYEFSAQLRLVHLLPADDRAWISSLNMPLSEEEQLAIVVARHKGWIDNGTLRQMTGQHPTDTTRTLGRLRDSGVLQMIGSRRGARYRLNLSLPSPASLPLFSSNITDTHPDSSDSVPSTTGFPSNTIDSVPSTTGFPSNTVDSAPSAHSPAIWSELVQIAVPVSAVRYISAQQRNDIVLELCQAAPLSLHDLMTLLKRNKMYVRSILKQLVDDGKLEYVFPDKLRHPQQRYRTAIHDMSSST